MRFLTSTAPVVLALVLGAPAAFADTMVGNQTITDADRAAVSEHCKVLMAGAEPSAPANSGNVDNASIAEVEADMTSGQSTPPVATSDGTEGNTDQELDAVREATAIAESSTAPETVPETAPNTGNPNNESISNVNLQAITRADCEAAGVLDW